LLVIRKYNNIICIQTFLNFQIFKININYIKYFLFSDFLTDYRK